MKVKKKIHILYILTSVPVFALIVFFGELYTWYHFKVSNSIVTKYRKTRDMMKKWRMSL